jgi:hypothetical protein
MWKSVEITAWGRIEGKLVVAWLMKNFSAESEMG